jgi:hypothetical protein
MISPTRSRILCSPNTPAVDDGAGQPSVISAKQLLPWDLAFQQVAIEPELAYGCVDWYLYPDTHKDAS